MLTGWLALLFGSIEYVGATSGTTHGIVNCSTIKIKEEKAFNMTCSPCTESVKPVIVCGQPFFSHVCRNSPNCMATGSKMDVSKCAGKNLICPFITGCQLRTV